MSEVAGNVVGRVFVTQEVTHRENKGGRLVKKFDFSKAWRYGQLVFLTSQTKAVYEPSVVLGSALNKLRDFNDEDYLLPIGDPVVVSACAAAAAAANRGRMNVLKWDKNSKDYVLFQLNVAKGG